MAEIDREIRQIDATVAALEGWRAELDRRRDEIMRPKKRRAAVIEPSD